MPASARQSQNVPVLYPQRLLISPLQATLDAHLEGIFQALWRTRTADLLLTIQLRGGTRGHARVTATPKAPETEGIAAPTLGYRGAFLHDASDRTWRTYGGAVTLEERERATTRRDPNRAFERLILDSAPPGTLPEWARTGPA